MPRSSSRVATDRMYTFIPPESPVPGWSIGDVCTDRIAARGSSLSVWAMRSWSLRWGVASACGGTLPRLRLFPRKGEARGDRGGRAVAAEEGRPPGRTEAAASARGEESQLVERLDRGGSGGPVSAVVDLHGDPDAGASRKDAVERLGALLHDQVGRGLHHDGVVALAAADHVWLGLRRIQPTPRRRVVVGRDAHPCSAYSVACARSGIACTGMPHPSTPMVGSAADSRRISGSSCRWCGCVRARYESSGHPAYALATRMPAWFPLQS